MEYPAKITNQTNIELYGLHLVVGGVIETGSQRKMSSEYVLIWAHYKSANLGINGPYKSAKEVYYKSAKNLPVFLMSNYYKNNKNII